MTAAPSRARRSRAPCVRGGRRRHAVFDEIGEIPRDLQPKLLRALEKREIKRLGGTRPIGVDVRVLAATNRNLLSEVSRGNFRQDLYYRIAAAKVSVPPLRERADDIPMLVRHFLALETPNLPARAIPQHVWEMFAAHRWPGNVRELRNAVQRLVVAPELSLHASDVTATGSAASESEPTGAQLEPLRVARRTAADAFEREYLQQVFARTPATSLRRSIAEVPAADQSSCAR